MQVAALEARIQSAAARTELRNLCAQLLARARAALELARVSACAGGAGSEAPGLADARAHIAGAEQLVAQAEGGDAEVEEEVREQLAYALTYADAC